MRRGSQVLVRKCVLTAVSGGTVCKTGSRASFFCLFKGRRLPQPSLRGSRRHRGVDACASHRARLLRGCRHGHQDSVATVPIPGRRPHQCDVLEAPWATSDCPPGVESPSLSLEHAFRTGRSEPRVPAGQSVRFRLSSGLRLSFITSDSRRSLPSWKGLSQVRPTGRPDVVSAHADGVLLDCGLLVCVSFDGVLFDGGVIPPAFRRVPPIW